MIASLTMMALGTFRFGVNRASYQTLTRSSAYRWATLDRAGAKSAAQFLGIGPEQMTLEGTIYPHFKGGLRQVELMRLVASAGQPLILVDGMGWVWDRWVITGVEERKSLFMADGAPRKIEFTTTLKAYGSDLA